MNAFHDSHYGRATPTPDPAKASRQAFDNTVAFYRGYRAAGGTSEQLLFQTWQPFPDRTGPETQACTVLYMTRELLRETPR